MINGYHLGEADLLGKDERFGSGVYLTCLGRLASDEAPAGFLIEKWHGGIKMVPCFCSHWLQQILVFVSGSEIRLGRLPCRSFLGYNPSTCDEFLPINNA